MDIPRHCFRAYDIRGIADGAAPEITPTLAYCLGLALPSFLNAPVGACFSLCHDERPSGAKLTAALIAGLEKAGARVLFLGPGTSPQMYFSVITEGAIGGIAVTASHNPPEYNGFKIVGQAAAPLSSQQLQLLADALPTDELEGAAALPAQKSIMPTYTTAMKKVAGCGAPAAFVLDAGSGSAGRFAPVLFEECGYTAHPLFCEPDGTFPHHLPDPEDQENMQHLSQMVVEKKAAAGFAFDGDGDRVGVVDETGAFIPADRLLVLLARDVLSRHPHARIILDLKCSAAVEAAITKAGGQVQRWKTGHTFIKQRMKETGALLAGEVSGHFFFNEKYHGVDDGILAALHLARIFSLAGKPVSTLLSDVPTLPSTPDIKIPLSEEHKAVCYCRHYCSL